ncbi:hypothetical protein R1flu_022684 [Riccia fluitans]|uniref:Secreted protein n=1 Tax=Riccia fluitans TaxID=41844 RepID=A0ABD1XQ00_9MARC
MSSWFFESSSTVWRLQQTTMALLLLIDVRCLTTDKTNDPSVSTEIVNKSKEISTSSKTVYRDLNDRCPSLLCQSLASSALSTSVFERVVELHISCSCIVTTTEFYSF